MEDIRKIVVGPDVKTAMKLIVGQYMFEGKLKIHHIRWEGSRVQVWVQRGDEVVKWKDYPESIVTFEFNIDF